MGKKRRRVKFSDKKHSVRGLISLNLGIISTIILGVLFYLSALVKGAGGANLGLIGFVLFILSIVGFVLGVKGYKEKEIYYQAPILGLLINGLLLVFLIILYFMGLYI
jgi:multisubunit Na+/H+ antiporter MnhB subunit